MFITRALTDKARAALDKLAERKILLRRFCYTDRAIFDLGRGLNIPWFQHLAPRFQRDTYAYFTPEEKLEATDLLCKETDDTTFVSALNRVVHPNYLEIGRFVGGRYFFDGSKFYLEDRRPALRKDVEAVLGETEGRVAVFLRALISLYHANRWDKAYGGAAWPDILEGIREIGGSYPSPRDLAILKSYRIYYRTGSRRYPTHTIPEEMIPTIEEVVRDVPVISSKARAINGKS
jgi:hypothetical protein